MGREARPEVVEVNRWIWIVRIFGILMLLAFMVMFASLQRRLVRMQGERPAPTTTSSIRAEPISVTSVRLS